MKNVAEILNELNIEKLSIAEKATIIREMMNYLKITDKQIEEYEKRGVTEDIQKEASSHLSSVVEEVARVGQEERKSEHTSFTDRTRDDISSISQTAVEFEIKSLNVYTNKNDDSSGNAEKYKVNNEHSFASSSQIQQFIIPGIVDRITSLGIQDNKTKTLVYKREDYTASLKLEEDKQILSLDKNFPNFAEDKEVLLVSKNNNSQEYSIVLNKLTQDEFERFKALFHSKSSAQSHRLGGNQPRNKVHSEQKQHIQHRNLGKYLS